MKRKFKLWWSSLPPISIKMNNRPILTHWTQIEPRQKLRNPSIGLKQAQKCGRVKPVTGILTLPSWQLDLRFSRIVIWLNYLHVSHDHVLRNLLETSKHIHIIAVIISEKHAIIYHSLKNGHLVNDIKIDKIHV